jgi:hypothetical protein
MPPAHLFPHLFEAGGPLALLGALVGGWLWHPDCAPTIGFTSALQAQSSQVCSNTWGALDASAATSWPWLVAQGALYGALIGVALAAIAVYVLGMSRRDVGLED